MGKIVAAVSNSYIRAGGSDGSTFDGISLDALPFPAAILNGLCGIVMANADWVERYPKAGPGSSLAEWCEMVHDTAPHLAGMLLAGAQRTLDCGERFVQKYGEGDRFQVSISLCGEGALVVHQDLYPAPERVRAQKLETMGRLAAGVAHDFANMITLIGGYCDILLKRKTQSEPLRPELEEVRKAVTHGARLTSQLLDFAQGQNAEPAPLDLNRLVREIHGMLRPILGEHVNLEIACAPGLNQVVARAGQMEQVVVNLILNARDAMPGGGTIRVSTSHNRDGDVVLSVADTGSGIAEKDLPHVFEPFFTTKASGKGTGLGLSTVREIIQQAGGEISVESWQGAGTVFLVRLPGVRPRPAVLPSQKAQTPRAGSETVLLVEDEQSVRSLLALVLRNRGYRVLEASNGAEALPLFESRAAEIDLVLTDIVMPEMNGLELAERVRASRPETPIVLMSGYSGDVLQRTGRIPPGAGFVRKPLHPDELAAAVRKALDS